MRVGDSAHFIDSLGGEIPAARCDAGVGSAREQKRRKNGRDSHFAQMTEDVYKGSTCNSTKWYIYINCSWDRKGATLLPNGVYLSLRPTWQCDIGAQRAEVIRPDRGQANIIIIQHLSFEFRLLKIFSDVERCLGILCWRLKYIRRLSYSELSTMNYNVNHVALMVLYTYLLHSH